MDIASIIAELRSELERLDQAIQSLERLSVSPRYGSTGLSRVKTPKSKERPAGKFKVADASDNESSAE